MFKGQSETRADVRYWHKADMTDLPVNVRFRGKADIAVALGQSEALLSCLGGPFSFDAVHALA